VKVALSGECADEIFGGYPWYRDPEIRDRAGFPWAQNTQRRAEFLHPYYRQKLNPEAFVADRYEMTLAQSDILPGTSPLECRMKQMINLNQRWFMQTLLDRKDRMSMACGLEVRVPFCDYRIAEYLYGVPWEFKEYEGREKGLLRKAMEGILPEPVLYRKKSPYPKTWHPGYLELMRERLDELLQRPGHPLFQVVDRGAISGMLASNAVWPWYGQLMGLPQTIAYFLQLAYWLEEYRVSLL
jgi:asparagine synthase (glutamine-hydrolysing)